MNLQINKPAHIRIIGIASVHTYILILHFLVSLYNVHLVAYAGRRIHKIYYKHTYLGGYLSGLSFFSCFYFYWWWSVSWVLCIKVLQQTTTRTLHPLQTREENRKLPCTAKVSSREATYLTVVKKESVLWAQTEPRDLAVKTASSFPASWHSRTTCWN